LDAAVEVMLSLGAVHTPKVLRYSGVGDHKQLSRHGIAVVQHLPGVGENLQDHPGFHCAWEYRRPLAPCNNAGEATYFVKSDPSLDTPDLQTCLAEVAASSAETAARFGLPEFGWTLFAGVVRPKSCGQVCLTFAAPGHRSSASRVRLAAAEPRAAARAARVGYRTDPSHVPSINSPH
jgi:choline dehydrogenase